MIILLVISLYVSHFTSGQTLELVSRAEWGARTPKERVHTPPAIRVIIHHTFIPKTCFNRSQCIQAMHWMQNFHMDTRGWSDIGYNFAIGEDSIYEGRGWEIVGAHTLGYNTNSLGVVFIGDYGDYVPSDKMLSMGHDLITFGIANRHIEPNYQLAGHRQFGNTECPGEALYELIQTWDHWTPHPTKGNTTNNTSNTTASGVKRMLSTNNLTHLNVLTLVMIFVKLI